MKQIDGFPDYYVTRDGQVWSNKNGTLKLRKGTSSKKGYLYLVLRNDGAVKNCQVHRLIAKAFIPNPDNLPEVNHKDGDKHNNAVTNLEWSTRGDNVRHAFASGLNSALLRRGELNVKSKLTDDDVRYIRSYSQHWGSKKELSEMFGVSASLISDVVLRRMWKHIE